MRIGQVLLLLGLAASVAADVHGPTGLIAELAGHDVVNGSRDWTRLALYLLKSFSDKRPLTLGRGVCRIWGVGQDLVVFRTWQPPFRNSDEIATMYWFDRRSAPISCSTLPLGDGGHCIRCLLVPLPGTSKFVLEVFLSEGTASASTQVNFGLEGRQPVLIRCQQAGQRLVSNHFEYPKSSYSPRAVAYTKSSLSKILSGSDPVLQLEALTWLSGTHRPLSLKADNVDHEPVADSIRYVMLTRDPEIIRRVSVLRHSKIRWIADAAAFFLSANHPHTAVNADLSSKLAHLEIKDLKLGPRPDDKAHGVRYGDLVKLEYEVKSPAGTTLLSFAESKTAPIEFAAGGGQVIEGLSKGVIGMMVGGVRKLSIPAAMAFGNAGANRVPPGTDLTYTVRLIQLKRFK